MKHWLMKSEPETFGIEHLAARPGQTAYWDGVRNYQARNMMRDEMRCGDQVLFYHSNTALPGIVGIAEVVREAYPDFTAWDPQSPYHDPRSTPERPLWVMVDVRLVRRLARVIGLGELREHAEALGDFPLLRRGNRLSVMPVTPAQWDYILGLERPADAQATSRPPSSSS
ncbi:putative RNA-binding protein with PUA-like domain [Plasticicumulans lactativorans]|uniref:Putative RNA-binding protein with PUA-like domain n=1 Tax=Plasticicumulans lactativorans TaxID=1133106 RepID=A0A4R2L4J9_9GAMM|nr:EVE domain-containing protein [Plasticicumulans lactativorans]TCO81393.1 putative RNA-binding protein with PUA-like domain [Plasticicumulans lactativorans]